MREAREKESANEAITNVRHEVCTSVCNMRKIRSEEEREIVRELSSVELRSIWMIVSRL